MAWVIPVFYFNLSFPETNWNWDKIDTQNIHFPNSFAWGTATAAHQVEGNNTNNNWYDWEHQLDENNQPRIHNGDKSILAADHWNRYPDDIKLMKDLGVNHYRFSIEWSKIEPENGNYDLEAIQHYRDLCDSLLKNNITPVVTLHHFTHPIWFEKLGAFEKRENIDHFIDYSEYAFNNLKDLVPIWCTINEPSVFVSQGYFNGIFPPGKKDPVLAAAVLENLLYAHTKTYKHLKNLDGGDQAQIGLVKNIFQFDPLRRWHILDWAFSKILNNVFTHSTLDYFKKGHATFSLPGMVKKHLENNDAIGAMDFVGLNYYSRMHVKGKANISEPFVFEKREKDIQTDMDYALYPEGFYKALHTISTLGKPIYVTENGVADRGNNIREIFIKRYLYALNKGINDGLDIRGYFYWTLMDNFEWAEGYKMKFGLYEIDFETQTRIFRESSSLFAKMVKKPGIDSRGYIVNIGDIAPNFTMEYLTGEKVTLSDLRGKVVVLQFTASWCSVCRKEMPHLEKDVWKQFKEKGLVLIGVDRDEPIETVKQFQKDMGTTYPLALDPGAKIFGLFADKNSGVTRNVVIDQQGKIVFLTRLFEKDEYDQMIEVIKSLL
ncbi:MAG: hypothetical protein CMF99_09670 [Candidatus Marinimicrobia bacterium]|nr:hypothetical protein [Candidatus Neomarinimicrobiota bacterium]|tara:strand:+ start:653 stop:2464 length:1812 start_codon:yes stop_codon:yes gene_type:complete